MPGYENYGIESGMLVEPDYIPHFHEISEQFPNNMVPLLDQAEVRLNGLTEDQRHWRDHGFVIKNNFIDHGLIDEYLELRRRLDLGSGPFPNMVPYLNHSVIRDICCSRELHPLLLDLLGEELGVHFLLTPFTSSERGWHQDDYLNPADQMSRYAAVWIAMGDIDPDCGPFEFVPASHKWPCLRRDKVQALVSPETHMKADHAWAVVAEYFVNKSVDAYIKERNARTERFIARKGDILIWHGKLMHRGSIPNNPNLLRPALIAHYSTIRSRRDIPAEITRHKGSGYFWGFSTLGMPLTDDEFSRIVEVAERDAVAEAPEALKRERNGVAVDASGSGWDHQARAGAPPLGNLAGRKSMKIEHLNLECLRLAQAGVSPTSDPASIEIVLERARVYRDFVLSAQAASLETGKTEFVENFYARDLEGLVKDGGFHFGDAATDWYFEPAEVGMSMQWEWVQRFLAKYPIDYTNTMELACGHGRNTEKLATLAKNIVLVDVNPENIAFCRKRFPDKMWKFVINNGFDLREIASNSVTFVYCFEAAVHFYLEVILSYIKEFRRVLAPGAFAFVHHSNVTANPMKDYKTHQFWRNYMSKDLFAHLCFCNGFEVVDQYVFDHGGPAADCFSLIRKDTNL